MDMTRLSPHATVFTSALILSFPAQSLLLAPNINTRLYTPIPIIWTTIGGWVFFLTSLSLLAVLILNPQKTIRLIILAFGFLVIEREPIWRFDLIIRDWVPILTLAINTIVLFTPQREIEAQLRSMPKGCLPGKITPCLSLSRH
jgi:hypothetical protein